MNSIDRGESKPHTARIRRAVRMQLGLALASAAGLGLAVFLVVHSGLNGVLSILASAGWGLLWLIPVHLVPITLDAGGWRTLLRGSPQAGLPFLAWAAAVRDAINNLLPVARVGGEVAGVRLLMMRGVSGTAATASVIVEITLTLAVQFLFTVLGLVLLLHYLRDHTAAWAIVLALLAGIPAIVIFFLLQHRWGLFQLIERGLTILTGSRIQSLPGDAAALDRAIQALYRQRRVIAIGASWQFAGLLDGAGELWFTLYLLGNPVTVPAAILLESLAQAGQSMAFLVPAALGVQEGVFLLFGAAVGLPADVAIALSLARRVRQIGLGVPLLTSWQWLEGRRLRHMLRRRAKAGLSAAGQDNVVE
jgi:putative membrane protein